MIVRNPVQDLAERIADYIETSVTYSSWSKRDCAIEAVRIACEDAVDDTRRLIDPCGEALAALTVQRDINLERAIAAENDRDARYRDSREAEAALRRLVELKDGPRDSPYHARKEGAWAVARAVVRRSSRPVDPQLDGTVES